MEKGLLEFLTLDRSMSEKDGLEMDSCGWRVRDESITIGEDEASTSKGQEAARWGKYLGGELSRTW